MVHRAVVIHHIPGRLRMKLPRAKGRPKLLQQIQESLSPVPGVQHVQVSPTTGSVVVHYDNDLHEDFHDHLADHAARAGLFDLGPPVLSEVDEIALKIEAEAEFLSAHSETARALVHAVKYLNESVRRATNNTVDLKVLLPLGLAAYSFFEVGMEMPTPMWLTLGIFSFNSFVALHRPVSTVNVAEHPVVIRNPQPVSRKAPVKPRKNRKRK